MGEGVRDYYLLPTTDMAVLFCTVYSIETEKRRLHNGTDPGSPVEDDSDKKKEQKEEKSYLKRKGITTEYLVLSTEVALPKSAPWPYPLFHENGRYHQCTS